MIAVSHPWWIRERQPSRWSMPPQPDQLRDGIIDLPRSDWLEKTNEQGSNRLKSGSKPKIAANPYQFAFTNAVH